MLGTFPLEKFVEISRVVRGRGRWAGGLSVALPDDQGLHEEVQFILF